MEIIRVSAGDQTRVQTREQPTPVVSRVASQPSGTSVVTRVEMGQPVITRILAERNRRKLRVAAYCRVSTKQENQEESLETQRETYTNLISIRSDWEFAGVYADKVSGLSAEKRPDFMKMIGDAMEGKIDRILCKSVSRFSRNVEECKRYADLLRTKNVTVEFEKEHIRTDDSTSSFVFSLMAAVAENESRSISENVRWSNRERVKRGEYNLGNNRILGYDSVDGKLVPNKFADGIRLIYTLFLEGESIEGIRQRLADIGIRTKSGGLVSHATILYILQNETYKGDKFLQKKPPKNLITGKPDPNVTYESNYLTDDHEAIVDKGTWDAVQTKIAENKKKASAVGHRGGQPHFLYGKIFCACGEPMVRRTVNGVRGQKCKTWICREQKKKGFSCKNRKIKEEKLLEEIRDKLGWEEFDEDEFGELVERVTVTQDGIEVQEKRETA